MLFSAKALTVFVVREKREGLKERGGGGTKSRERK